MQEQAQSRIARDVQSLGNLKMPENTSSDQLNRTASLRSAAPPADLIMTPPVADPSLPKTVPKGSPPIDIKCGPLLRYWGMRDIRPDIWRGSIIIVTNDKTSDYSAIPYATFSVSNVNPQVSTSNLPTSAQNAAEAEIYRVEAKRYHQEYGVSFYRFDMEFTLGPSEKAVTYFINSDSVEEGNSTFYIPAATADMNIMFYSCNGFSLSVDPSHFKGYLWEDVLRYHNQANGAQHLHCMLGGGDQIYCDKVKLSTIAIKLWTKELNVHKKRNMPFDDDKRVEVENFYLWHYISWFGLGYFAIPKGTVNDKFFVRAQACIPQINIFDDHDIIDGFGSYTDRTMCSPSMMAIGQIAYKYYMLFQHGVHPDDKAFFASEPSYVQGTTLSRYIKQPARSVYARMGPSIAFYGLDCRTERTHDTICDEATYDAMFHRLNLELAASKGEIKHLLVMLGVPIAYPRLVWLERILTSRAIAPIRAMSRHGFFVGLNNGFDDSIEILDDLEDHWCAKNHKLERNTFMTRLQEFAQKNNVRITILSGDVHLAAIGRFYGIDPKSRLPLPVEKDPRHMLNVISSAITNTPPSNRMADFLNKRNKTHHFNENTDENMVRIFNVDVDGTKRHNTCLLPRRNWCSITVQSPQSASSRELYPGQAAMGAATASSERLYKDIPGALNVVLHMERDPLDSSGATVPYDILVPPLD